MRQTAKQLLQAVEAPENGYLCEYLLTYPTNGIKEDIKALIDASVIPSAEDLKAFTMAAMKGLCHMAGTDVLIHGGLTVQQVDNISECAIAIAEATLSKLSKHQ